MPRDHVEEARATAIDHLTALGLSTYAARTFVALTSLGEGTAQDVSDVVDVPRTRVYDAAEELIERGLVDAKQANPKQFWAISTETTGRHFEQEYAHHVSMLTDALDVLGTESETTEQQGVWTVTGRETVTERVVEFISRSEDEVVFMTVEDMLTDGVVDALSNAADRGVTIRFADMSSSTEMRLAEEIPEADVFDSLWAFEDTPAGRLLMVDQERTLVSVLVPGNGDTSPAPRDETAIWGAGETNSLVVVLKALFTWELDGNRS
jgi:sugar-specific transcriptional regulator TrmB